MKRLVLMMIVFLTGFTLSGCDLIPQDVVDQVSEELCREDPTNELCMIDDLSNITETVAEELVLDAIDTLNASNAEVCDTVFSITNTDLLDACENGTLLPEGVTSFDVLSYEQDGDMYIFEGSTGDDGYLEIQMSIGEVDGNMRVTSFTATVIDAPMESTEVDAAEFKTFFMQFITDYLDSMITTENLVATYFETAPDADFTENRMKDQEDNISITYISEAMLDVNHYEVTIDITSGEETMREEIEIKVNRIDMALRLEILDDDDDCDGIDCEADEMVTAIEFETLFQQFVADYFDTTISDEVFEDTYFMDASLTDFDMNRQEEQASGVMITYISSMMVGDNEFEVTLEFDEDGSKRTDTIKVKVNRIEMALYLWFDGVDQDCDGIDDECIIEDPVTTEEFTVLFNQFILDYFDTTIPDSDFEMMYFMDATLDDFEMNRQEDQTSGLMISFVSAMMMGENEFEVTLEFEEDGATRTDTIDVKVNRIEMALYLWFDGVDQDCDGIDDECTVDEFLVGEEAITYLQGYFNDYSNLDITNEQFAQMYFDGYLDDMFAQMRTKDLEEGFVFALQNVTFFEDGSFEAEYSQIRGNDIIVHKRPGRIRKRPDLLTAEWDELIDHFVTGEEAVHFLEQYFNDYSNPEITNEDFSMMYLDGMMDTMILEERTVDLNDGAVLELVYVHFYDDGSFEAEYTRTAGDDIILRKRPGRIRKRPDLLTAEWDQLLDEHVEQDINVVTETFTQFITDYLNQDLSNEDLQMMYFGGMDMMWFLGQRQEDLSRGLDITLDMIEPWDGYGHFVAKVVIIEDGTSRTEEVIIKVMKRIDQTTPLLLIIDTGGEDNDCDLIGDFCEVVTDPALAKSLMMVFLDEYNNPDITNDVLSMYFLDYFWMLDMREQDQAEGLIWMLEDVVERLDDDVFLFRLYAQNTDGIVHRDIAARVYRNGSIAVFRDKGIDPDTCVLTTNVCHFMTVVDDDTIVEELFVAFLHDFVNPDMTFEDINYMYFMGKAPEFLREHFEQNNPRGATVEFTSIVANADHPGFYDLSYSMVTPTFTKNHDVTVILWFIDGMPVFEFFDSTNECHMDPYACMSPTTMYEHNLDMITPFVEELFAILNDDMVTNDMIRSFFVRWMAPEALLTRRADDAGAVFVFERITAPEDVTVDPFFTITYRIEGSDIEPTTETLRVQFVYTEMGFQLELEMSEDMK